VTIVQKAAFSILVSIVVLAVFSVIAFTGLFNLVETRFYNPSIMRFLTGETEADAQAVEIFLTGLQNDFAGTLNIDAVKQSFLSRQDDQDILERAGIFGLLFESQKGLQSVRFVDKGGQRVHFSTNPEDILNRNEARIAYKNYSDTVPFTPYSILAVPEQGQSKITFDSENDRIVFSFPFYDSMELYQGTAMYSLSAKAVTDMLIAKSRLKAGEEISLVADPAGMASGLPVKSKHALVPVIAAVWAEGVPGLSPLDSDDSASPLVLVSVKPEHGFFMGRVVEEKLFAFPLAMKLILLASLFCTTCLVLFLCLNFRADAVTIIQNRLKHLKFSLLKEYYERKGDIDWNRWRSDLENRREEVRTEIKRGVKASPDAMETFDVLINKSWDEILDAIAGRPGAGAALNIDENKLQTILNQAVLAAGSSDVSRSGRIHIPPPPAEGANTARLETVESAVEDEVEEEVEEVEEVEELEELDEIEELEELDDFEQIAEFAEGEELEELEELGNVEEPDDAEEVLELDDSPAEPVKTPPESRRPVLALNDIASQIEFGGTGHEEHETEEAGLNKNLEIVSPFTTMFSRIDGRGSVFDTEHDEGTLEELEAEGLFLMYQPFQFRNEAIQDGLLDCGNSGEAEIITATEITGETEIIHEKDGINYVNTGAAPDETTERSLDPSLKNLVDSVMNGNL
jgi:hypothetical protein